MTEPQEKMMPGVIELSETDRKILNLIQLDFPLTVHPYADIAAQLGITEDEVIDRLKRLTIEGAVRRIGPILNTKGMGGSNTLVAVKVPPEQIDAAAAFINRYPEVSHNYLRTAGFNIWFTLSAPTRERIDTILKEIEDELKCPVLDLPTIRQYKIQVRFVV